MTRLGLLVASALLAGCALVYDPIEQSFLYRHRPVDEARYKAILERDPGIEEVRLAAADGTRLHGILKRAPKFSGAARYPLVIVFGGVARETSWMANWGDKPDDWGWLMVNYRGYGLSEGRPTQEILLEDAQLIYDWAAARPDVDPANIVVLGRSLGSYVAVSLATRRPVRALILATPFDSFAALARQLCRAGRAPLSVLAGRTAGRRTLRRPGAGAEDHRAGVVRHRRAGRSHAAAARRGAGARLGRAENRGAFAGRAPHRRVAPRILAGDR
jgi:pimeloyl-ACP methyl ester carboxylesterase